MLRDIAEVQFSIAYGDANASGSPTLTQDDSSNLPSKAIYNQLKNVLLDSADSYFTDYAGNDMKSFYALNVNRARYKERLDPGNISINLSGSVGMVTLIDNSGGTDENVTTAGRIYYLASGSLNIGSATFTKEVDKEIARAVVDDDSKLNEIFDEIDAQAEVGQFTQDEPEQEDQEVEQEEI